MMSKVQELVRILPRLGTANVLRVAMYRANIKLGVYKSKLPIKTFSETPLFSFDGVDAGPTVPPSCDVTVLTKNADRIASGSFPLFASFSSPETGQVDWFRDNINGSFLKDTQRHWSEISDFGEAQLDIKSVWEMSRFAWVLTLARAFRVTKNSRYSIAMNTYVDQWRVDNPINQGPNWKCGQETAIRLLHVLMSAYVIGQDRAPTPALIEWVNAHCKRIATTTTYAVGQDNNHIVSEAAALFVAGTWLQSHDGHSGSKWAKTGRQLLEQSVSRLIGTYGDFAQYSAVYHRLMLDTLSLAEFWRMRLGASDFSDTFKNRAAQAAQWLATICDSTTGDVPNLGANDGAHEYCLNDLGFRDFRPSVQLAAALFHQESAIPPGDWNEGLEWMGLTVGPVADRASEFKVIESASFFIGRLATDNSLVVVRQPKYRFRPSHADALHVDYFVNGVNLLRDSGTFSYAVDIDKYYELAGTSAHNTVSFDDEDQMPRIGRFLFGRWLNAASGRGSAKENCLEWRGDYTDWRGNQHRRSLEMSAGKLIVSDEVAPKNAKATLRWRLPPGDWRLNGTDVSNGPINIDIKSAAVLKPVLKTAIESRHYFVTTDVTVLEIFLGSEPVSVKTVISFLV